MEEEPLMNFRPKSSHQKIIWLEYEKEMLIHDNIGLKIKISELQNEIDNLKQLMATEEKGSLILKHKKLIEEIKNREHRIRDLKKENEMFLQKIIKLQIP